jgi:uracil-DNA glycosylase family 4
MVGEGFKDLLEATIQHVEQLRDNGQRSIRASPSCLAALSAPRSQSVPEAPTARATPRTEGHESQDRLRQEHTHASVTRLRWDAPAIDSTAKLLCFQQLHQKVQACMKCPNLASSRTNVVFGTGSIDSDILFVGEAPGAEEDRLGEPFVGKAGELLTKIIQAMGLSREKVYIANVLKCRPDTPGQSSGNRKPDPTEMATCLPYLEEQIAIIRPKIMVALGATAIEGLLGQSRVQVTRIRGQWLEFHGIPLMPTYHPAYLLRNDSMTEKRKVWEDMLAVMERMNFPISQKQRNFFLKAQ